MPAKKTTKTTKTTKTVMDVSKPGKTPPSATSKPVIVGHKPMMKDSMDVNVTGIPPIKDESTTEKITVSRTGAKVITPITITDNSGTSDEKPADPSAEDTATETVTTTTTETTTPETPEEETADTGLPDEDKPEDTAAAEPAKTTETVTVTKTVETSDKSKDNDSKDKKDAAVVDAVAGQALNNRKDPKAEEEAAKHRAEVEKLVEEKKFFVPTGQVTHKRHKKWLVGLLFLAFLITGGGLLAAADAGLINGVTPPFDFIPDQTTEEDTAPVATPKRDDTKTDEQSAATDKQNTPGTATPSATEKDKERTTDIDLLAAELEKYYTQKKVYPTLANLNDEAWRTANMKGVLKETLRDPDGTSYTLVVTPTAKSYAYAVTPTGCDNSVTDCTGYTLTATLFDGKTYQKKNTTN